MTEERESTAGRHVEGSNRVRKASTSPGQSPASSPRLLEEHLAYVAALLLLNWSAAVLLWGTGT